MSVVNFWEAATLRSAGTLDWANAAVAQIDNTTVKAAPAAWVMCFMKTPCDIAEGKV
ncbi:hypothetical protein GCM10027292_13300 [Hydrogenophaga aquatica]